MVFIIAAFGSYFMYLLGFFCYIQIKLLQISMESTNPFINSELLQQDTLYINISKFLGF